MPADIIHDNDPLQWLESTVRTRPDAPFLTTVVGGVISYAELDLITRRVAAALRALGATRGERVCVAVEKSVEAVFLYVACLRLGAVYMPLNTAYTAAELDYFLDDARPKLLIVGPAAVNAELSAAASRCGARMLTLDAQGEGSFADWIQPFGADALEQRLSGDDLAALVYTSGTTGRSKGAMITRANLAAGARALTQAWEFTHEDVLLHVLPLFHVHGLFMALNTVLAAGASMLFVARFEARETVELLPRATAFMGVPTHYTRLLAQPAFDVDAARGVRLFVSGSAPLLAETHREFEARCGHRILERYGMTETQVNASNPLHGERKPGSVGPPLPNVEIRIVPLADDAPRDDERRAVAPSAAAPSTVAPGVGMIEVRGANVFKGYWNAPDKTAADLRADGFFITGDIGRFDAAGYLYIVGRAKDLIISGGYNVYPIEVEEAIDALPGVIDSAVIGLPHADFGEGVTAVVATRAPLSEDVVLDALKQRLANYKIPKRVLFVPELPRNAMGKVQKQALRALHAGLYR